jgi:rhomboid family GlyGly-CTERM serine protease
VAIRGTHGPGRAGIAAAAAVLAAALLASAFPAAFVLERGALAHGEWWRLWTCHLVHASRAHFLLDVGAALVLVPFVRARAACFVLVGLAPLVGAGALALSPQIGSYGGLSGLLHALTLLAAFDLARDERGAHRALAAGVVLVTVAKACVEVALQRPLLTSGLDMGGEPVFVAHALGALGALGALAWFQATPAARAHERSSAARSNPADGGSG